MNGFYNNQNKPKKDNKRGVGKNFKFKNMARGKNCPQSSCGHPMYAVKHEDEPFGTWVTYKCRACGFEERIFESNGKNG
jgi:hypothetical protein